MAEENKSPVIVQVKETKSERETREFNLFEKTITPLGFRRMTPEMIEKIIQRLQIDEPDSPRIEQTRDQVIFYNYQEPPYKIVIITSYNPKMGEFTTKGGSPWLIISKNVHQRAFVRQFYRWSAKSVFKKLALNAEFWVNRLENRPTCPDCKGRRLMVIEKTHSDVFWYCKHCDKVLLIDLGKVPAEALKEFRMYQKNLQYYHAKTRDKLGIVNYISDLRKIWKKKKKK